MNDRPLSRLSSTLAATLAILSLVYVACGPFGFVSKQQQVMEEASVITIQRERPEEAAAAVLEVWARDTASPFRNDRYEILTNDGTFSTVRITAEFREAAESDWVEKSADTECRNISGKWQCETSLWFYLWFEMTEYQKEAFENAGQPVQETPTPSEMFEGFESVLPDVQETPTTPPILLRPLSITSDDMGDGWTNLDVEVAIVNDDSIWHNFVSFGNASAVVVTNEGYDYAASMQVDSYHLLPPGFQSRGLGCGPSRSEHINRFQAKVATNSTGHKLVIFSFADMILGDSYEEMKVGEIEVDLSSSSPFVSAFVSPKESLVIYEIGETVELPESNLTLTNVQREGDTLAISYEFSNLSGGYDIAHGVTDYVIGDDGIMYGWTAEGCAPDWDTGEKVMKLEAGPAQSVVRTATFGVPRTVSDLYYVATIAPYGYASDPLTHGLVFGLKDY